MADGLAVAAWALIGFFAGIVPGAWLVETDHPLAGIATGLGGFLLGGLAAEGIVRWAERGDGE